LPRISRGVYLLEHFVPTNDTLIVKMPVPLRSNLILNLYRVSPASLEHLYGSRNVQRITKSGVGINYQGEYDGISYSGHVFRKLCQGDEANVGNSKIRVCDPGTRYVDSLKPNVFDYLSRQSVRSPRDQKRVAFR
jgi:hypothetical protein